jgi:HAD superfamily hydrolase (TIGR01509 family)
MAMAIETVFLDAGGVLIQPNVERVSAVMRRYGIIVDADALLQADHHVKHELDKAKTIESTDDTQRLLDYLDRVLKRAGAVASPALTAAAQELYAYHTERNLWETIPAEVVPALERLRAAGLRLAVISNANGTVHDHFNRLGLTPYFDQILDSRVEGVEKPDPRIFERALERMRARPERSVHLGDLYYVDVVGARSAGMQAVLLDAADLYGDADCPRVPSLTAFVDQIQGHHT